MALSSVLQIIIAVYWTVLQHKIGYTEITLRDGQMERLGLFICGTITQRWKEGSSNHCR